MRFVIWSFRLITIFGLSSMPLQAGGRDIVVFEQSTRTLQEVTGEVEGQAAYLPVSFFESALHLERKDLAPGLVGMCRDDLCIPLPIRARGAQEYVSALGLIEGLSGAYVWDAEGGQLFLDMRPQWQEGPSEGLVDFSLPDLEGRTVRLSDFRGKKVAIFAWASW